MNQHYYNYNYVRPVQTQAQVPIPARYNYNQPQVQVYRNLNQNQNIILQQQQKQQQQQPQQQQHSPQTSSLQPRPVSPEIPLKDFIKSILRQRGQIKNEDVLEKVTSGEFLSMYEKAFTSPSIDPENSYENYEFLGDGSSNKCIIFYLYKKFPQLQQPLGFKIMSRLKILYVSKKIFQHIGDQKLGFLPYIKVDPALMETQRFKILTDVFEAFIAATEMIFDSIFELGVGYAVVYTIISSIFDEIHISLKYEDLYDSITRIKELFESREFKSQLGPYNYDYQRKHEERTVMCNVINKGRIIGTGSGLSQGAAQQRAAQEALNNLEKMGFKKTLPEPWASLRI